MATASTNITALVKIILFGSTSSVQLTCQVFSCEFCEVSKNGYSYRTPPVAASECSRNLEFEKQTDQNFITENLHHGDLHFEEKDTVKAMSKGGYI